ncbi:hypothetical protein BpHYR1_005318 [Brachionus plicatilis]|uniref:Uncharacterized protein n=1 Tax=Brachionus plicatilis TaxID=10195 RepID=A0A3M7QAX1_BRAPC|nr:hypothetical protein BpHYR1_005318 [Brachionus plicatilis]
MNQILFKLIILTNFNAGQLSAKIKTDREVAGQISENREVAGQLSAKIKTDREVAGQLTDRPCGGRPTERPRIYYLSKFWIRFCKIQYKMKKRTEKNVKTLFCKCNIVQHSKLHQISWSAKFADFSRN